MYLTPIEQLALPTVKWLMSHDGTCGGTGRSTVIAYALIETAIENVGKDIDIWDHYGTYDAKGHMYNRIQKLWEYLNYPEYELEFNRNKFTFRAKIKRIPIVRRKNGKSSEVS